MFNHPLDKARPLHHVGPQQQSQNIASGNTTMSDKAATAPRTPAGASAASPRTQWPRSLSRLMVSLSAITSALSSESSIVSTAILLENPLPKDPPARFGTLDARPKRRHGDRSQLRSCQCTFGLEQGAHDACVLTTFPPRPPPSHFHRQGRGHREEAWKEWRLLLLCALRRV